jgi:probable rRNA maturation factor
LKISFNYHRIKFRVKNARKTKKWLLKILKKLAYKEGKVEIHFVSKSKILELNKEFLHHNYFTDIITFSYSEEDKIVSAELFICPWQVKKNAHLYREKVEIEIRRVLVHGVLHCAGYHDLTVAETRAMREAEDLYLKIY